MMKCRIDATYFIINNKTGQMILNLLKGFSYIFKGLSLITQKGIRPFVVIPLLINISVFSLAIWITTKQLDNWMEKLLPNWLTWLEWLLWPIFAVLFFFIIFYTFTVVANLIAAPFNAMLAERVENKLNGLTLPEFKGYTNLVTLFGRTFKSETQKLFYMAKWFIGILILTVIPGLNILSPFIWLIFGAWMLAIEYIDYPMGNHDYFFKSELSTFKKHRSLSFGLGVSIALLTAIPVINFLAMPAGVAASTALWTEKLSQDYANKS